MAVDMFISIDPENIPQGISVQLALEQHRFEPHRSTYMQVFSVNILEKSLDICDNLKKLTLLCLSSLLYCESAIYNEYTKCVNLF